MLNIVIPMAGRGSRFADAGYTLPKPFIPLHGVPMIQVVVDNLRPARPHRFLFICQNSHIEEYDLITKLTSYAENVEVIGIDGVTEGQICTVLKARHLIDNDMPLMTANSDQFIDFDINDYLADIDRRELDGMIMTMRGNDPKWSFAKVGPDGYVVQTAEKEPISDEATVGIYNFSRGSDLVRAADAMVAKNLRVNNEFYTCPCYNQLIEEGRKIGVYGIGGDRSGMYGLGTPADLEFFLKHPVSQKIMRAEG